MQLVLDGKIVIRVASIMSTAATRVQRPTGDSRTVRAHQAKQGQIELAAGGVLFLDEVSELTPVAQLKVLAADPVVRELVHIALNRKHHNQLWAIKEILERNQIYAFGLRGRSHDCGASILSMLPMNHPP